MVNKQNVKMFRVQYYLLSRETKSVAEPDLSPEKKKQKLAWWRSEGVRENYLSARRWYNRLNLGTVQLTK